MASTLWIISVSLLLIKLSQSAPANGDANNSTETYQDLLTAILSNPQGTNDVQEPPRMEQSFDTLLTQVFNSTPPKTSITKVETPTKTESDQLDFVFPDSPFLKNRVMPTIDSGIVEPQLNMTSNQTLTIDDFNKIGPTAIRTIVG